METGPWGVEAREATWRERILVRLLVRRLDQQLAAGRSPESSPLLSLRAQRLARPATRQALARAVGRLLREASAPHAPTQPSLVDFRAVRGAEPDLVGLLDQLVAPAPVSARGVALVHELFADGRGPLYGRSASALRQGVRRASRALEPDVDWPQAA
ncbi:MAG: hypothetical protein AB7O74_10895 [Candidatus Nanopelagicales bacterium]